MTFLYTFLPVLQKNKPKQDCLICIVIALFSNLVEIF